MQREEIIEVMKVSDSLYLGDLEHHLCVFGVRGRGDQKDANQEWPNSSRTGVRYQKIQVPVSLFTEENNEPFSFHRLCLICRIKENNCLENDSAVGFICHMTELSFLFL